MCSTYFAEYMLHYSNTKPYFNGVLGTIKQVSVPLMAGKKLASPMLGNYQPSALLMITITSGNANIAANGSNS